MATPLDILENDKCPSIVVLGATGSGKSTFINDASNSTLPVGSDYDPCTTTIQLSLPVEVKSGYRIRLVDTPGDEETNAFPMITDFLAGLYRRKIALVGLIYIQSLSNPRVGGISRRNMRMFRDICGEDAMKKVMIVTTGIDANSEVREASLRNNPKFFQSEINEGASLVRHDGTADSAKKIILQMIEGVADENLVLRIQEELVDEGKGLSESSAGGRLDPQLVATMRNHEQSVKEICTAVHDDSERAQVLSRIEELDSLLALAEAERDELTRVYNHAISRLGRGLRLLDGVILAGMLLIALWLL